MRLGHVVVDIDNTFGLLEELGLGMSLAAVTAASRPADNSGRTFGSYRLEILAALANAVLLFGVAAYVLYEAIVRLADPPEVLSTTMAIAALGPSEPAL